MLGTFSCVLSSADYFQNIFVDFFQEYHKVSNSLDPDQVEPFVRPDLGINCLQRLSADGTGRQELK